MSNDIEKTDMRVKKTTLALKNAMIALLNHRGFNQITVNDLCKEALVSRAAFYAHFNNKYDLLEYWFTELSSDISNKVHQFEELEGKVNKFISSDHKTIKNILKEADSETLELVQDFMAHIIEPLLKRNVVDETNPNHIILFNFCTGGLVHHLLWQVKNNFPAEIAMLNNYLYKMLRCIMEWDAKQEKCESTARR